MRDILELSGTYQSVQIPVRYGNRLGEVQNFLQNSRTLGNLRDYVSSLQTLVEQQKYYDSQKRGYDVGPTIAVANLFENGYHREFVGALSKKGIILNGCEQVLKVTENGDSYHILPLENFISLNNDEQRGIIAYSVWRNIIRNPNLDKRLLRNEWACNDNFKNSSLFRETMDYSKIKVIEGPHVYEGCLIYKNLCKNLIKRFEMDEAEIEKVSPLELSLAIA